MRKKKENHSRPWMGKLGPGECPADLAQTLNQTELNQLINALMITGRLEAS